MKLNAGSVIVQRSAEPDLTHFFQRLIWRSFDDLNLATAELRTYVVEILTRFVRTDALYRLNHEATKRLETVVEMLIEAENTPTSLGGQLREREVRQYTGDFALFMSGIFRPFVERHGILGFYLEQGENAYRDTAALKRQLYQPGAGRFEELAQSFELISGGLDYMRKVYFFSDQKTPFGALLDRFNCWN